MCVFIIDLRERGRETRREEERDRQREREMWKRNIHWLPPVCMHPKWRLSPTTFWSVGWCSNQLSHLARAMSRVFILQDKKFRILVVQWCKYTQDYWTIHLQMVRMVNFMLSVLYHNYKILNNGIRTWIDMFPKKICKWPKSSWKDSQQVLRKRTLTYVKTLGVIIKKWENKKCWQGCRWVGIFCITGRNVKGCRFCGTWWLKC